MSYIAASHPNPQQPDVWVSELKNERYPIQYTRIDCYMQFIQARFQIGIGRSVPGTNCLLRLGGIFSMAAIRFKLKAMKSKQKKPLSHTCYVRSARSYPFTKAKRK